MKDRLTFSTLGTTELTFDELISKAKQYGMKSIELRGVLDSVAINDIPFLFPENINETKAKLSYEGIDFCVLGTSAVFHTDSAAAVSECEYSIWAAKELNVPYIRVFGDRCENESMFNTVKDGLKTVCRAAENSGVTVLLETHGDFATAELLKRLLYEVNSPCLALLWDIQHTHSLGENAEKFASEMLGFIRHVHIKDMKANGSLCMLGDGEIDFYKTAKMLEKLGFNGLYSLEWEKRWHPELPSLDAALAKFTEIMV